MSDLEAFRPRQGTLYMGIVQNLSNSSHGLNIDEETKRDIARKRMEEVSNEFNLGLDEAVESVEIGDLRPGALAATVPTYEGPKIVFDRTEFFRQSPYEQRVTAAHEGIHVHQFNDTLGDLLRDEHGAYRLAEEVEDSYKDRADMEGEVEVIIDRFFPEQNSSYPYWKRQKERELEMKDIDVDSELLDDMEEFEDDLLEDYRQVYGSLEGDAFYVEAGEFNGKEYEAIVLGSEAPEYGQEIVTDYLERNKSYWEKNLWNEEVEKYDPSAEPELDDSSGMAVPATL